MTTPWPAEIRIRTADHCLEIEWDDGRRDMLPAELLRVESPSAEVQGHGADTKQIIAGKRSVTIVGAEPVGNYAVRLIFDDGHDSGLYTWATLRHFAEDQAEIFATYLQALDSRGLKR